MNQASRQSWLVPVLPAACQPGSSPLRAVPVSSVSVIMVFIIATSRAIDHAAVVAAAALIEQLARRRLDARDDVRLHADAAVGERRT